MIAVQLIEMRWYKSARGVQGGQRTASPRAFALQPSHADVLVQRHRLNAWQDWAATSTTQKSTAQEIPSWQPGQLHVVNELALRLAHDVLEAAYLNSPWSAKPARHPAPCVMKLPARVSGPIMLSARHTSYSGQTCVEQTCSPRADAALPPDAFTAQPSAVCRLPSAVCRQPSAAMRAGISFKPA